MRSPAQYGPRLRIASANAKRGMVFFLFACPKRKNQRETTLGRGRLRFLPLPRPTLIQTPKRGDPLLDHPRAVRIRPGFLYLPGSPAGAPASPSGGGVAQRRWGPSRRTGTSPAPTWGRKVSGPARCPSKKFSKKAKKLLQFQPSCANILRLSREQLDMRC